MLKWFLGLVMPSGATLTAIGLRILAGILVAGGVYVAVVHTWNSWKSNLCQVQVDAVTGAIKDKTIADLQQQLKDQQAQLQNLEARRADDQLAVQMATSQAASAMDELKVLSEKEAQVFIPDTHVDIINGVLQGERSATSAKTNLGGSP